MVREMKDSGIPWIGQIPSSWEVLPLKTSIKWKSEKNHADATVLSLYRDYGIVPKDSREDNFNVTSLDTSGYKYVEVGDLVINKMKAWQGSIAVSDYEGIVSPAYHVCQVINSSVFKKFLHYLLRNSSYLPEYMRLSTGMRIGQWDLGYDDFKNIPIVLPDYKEQQRIVAFLDTECSRIDVVIEKTRASIEEYKKLKQAVITQAVTKGIRGNRPMKDSGVEWIGEIPEEWNVYRVANLYDERVESGSEELPILTVSINTGISDHEIADEEKDRVFVRSEDRTKYKRVYPGDLAYNMMRAWQGAFGAVRVDGMVSPAYVVARPKNTVVIDSRYMEALLRTAEAIEEMHRYSRGIVDFRLRLYWPEFKNIRVCLPPITEQTVIADYIDKKNAEIDSLISQKEHFLTELETYKKSLIYEYVTGKKEVV